ncbi:DUF4091 domain-containing protein [Sphingobacterium tabacisoli]|uniref:Glycoside hydrolase domain-containing protein n=1 Tax=Sphingobacterium tabacisoli TaxID=2044855 RepID=A0ABW5L068_9SPHI|nr:DUF4091 domain-containing protein [Sphingobacterium tabacisoli]
MKRRNLIWGIGVICFSVWACGPSSKQKEAPIKSTFEELADPQAAQHVQSWDNGDDRLKVSFVTIDQRFAKSSQPDIKIQNKETLTGWRGEILSAQVLLWSNAKHDDIMVTLSDFVGDGGTITKQNAQARFVRYVMTDEFGKGCGERKPEDYPASLSPDILDNINQMNLPGKTVRPVWITLHIPRDAKPGKYTGKIIVEGQSLGAQELSLDIDVINQELPPASSWTFHLDQWQHPSAVARWNKVPLWSEEHFNALRPQMELLASAGQKVITATLNKDPWNVQTQDPYADMILWTKEKDGSWTYDYSVFDKWVSFMMDLGIKKSINCYSIVPWNNEIHYKDAATAEVVNVVAQPGTDTFIAIWEPFLKDFSKHLKEKGWLGITNIALDERNSEEMAAAFSLIEGVAPGLGVAYADNKQTFKRYPTSQDISSAVQHPLDSIDIATRKAKGLNTTFYIYCNNSFPNQFTFSAPAESTYLGWYTLATGYDGVLRWAYNSWVENPLLDSRFRTWPAGDTFVVYPDARSSVRFERMREGIQDYEKVQIVKKQLTDKKDEKSLAQLNSMIAKFRSHMPSATWNEDLNVAKSLLNQLSR